jgi:hypothetical protein
MIAINRPFIFNPPEQVRIVCRRTPDKVIWQ